MRASWLLTLWLVVVPTIAADAVLRPYHGELQSPSLALPDLAGEIHRLSDYRGQVVLVNFWATWCSPCLEEMPSLDRLEQRLSGEPFKLLTVNIGESKAPIREWMRELGVRFTVLLDRNGRTAREWRVLAYPSTFVVGRDGRIVYATYGALKWHKGATYQRIAELVGR